MLLRALQDATVTLPVIGLKLVYGPEYSEDDQKLKDGQTVEVPDDFLVNPTVWDVVKPPDGGYRFLDSDGKLKHSKKQAAAAAS